MPIPSNMSERETRMYWGTVHKLVKAGKSKEEAEKIAYQYISGKRGKIPRAKNG